MAELKFLNKNPVTEIRELVLNALQQSGIFRRQADIDFIASQLDTVEPIQSFIPAVAIEERDPVYSEMLHQKMEGCFVDHSILLARIQNLLEGMEELDELYRNQIQSAIDQVDDFESRVRVFKKLRSRKGVFNTVLHETFTNDNNFEGTDRRLEVNRDAGTLRLPAEGKLLTTEERSNLSLEVLTRGVTLIDEAPLDTLFDPDPFRPWFLSFVSSNLLINDNYSHIDLRDYSGVAVIIRVTFPSVQQLNRISLSHFGNDLLGVFYSEEYDQDLNSIAVKKANVQFYQDGEEDTLELNMVETLEDGTSIIINAAEVMIVLGMKDYLQVDTSFSYDTFPERDELKQVIRNQEFEQRKEQNSLKPIQQEELLDPERVLAELEQVDVKEGDRNYIIGMNNFSIQNLVYAPFGIFRSPKFTINGNLVSFGLDVTKKTDFTIREAVELFYININENRVPIGSFDEFGRVADSALLQAVDIANSIYSFSTNFIPKLENGDFENAELYLDGLPLLPGGYSIFRKTRGGYEIRVTNVSANEGSIVTMAYSTADLDHEGNTYEPDRFDVIRLIGKPNIDINFITFNTSDFLFIKDNQGRTISFIEGQEINIGEVDEQQFAIIAKTESKGIVPQDVFSPPTEIEAFFDLDNFYYIEIEKVVDITDAVYGILKNERPIYNGNPITSGTGLPTTGTLTFRTTKEYARNLIVLEVDDRQIRLTPEQQYSIDTEGNIQSKFEFRVDASELAGAQSIFVHYHPVFDQPQFLQSNIVAHNDFETFDSSTEQQIELQRFPYIDETILTSPKWRLSRGIFYLLDNFSISYEPLLVTVNGVKAFNVTQFTEDQESQDFAEDEITYEVIDNRLKFNQDVENVEVKYYFLGNSFFLDIEMFKGDNSKYFTTPEIKDYTVLTAVRK